MTPGQGKQTKLMATKKALGYFYARLSNQSKGWSGGNPGAGHSFDDDNTQMIHLPDAPLSAPRMAGRCVSRFHHMSIIKSDATPTFYLWVSRP